MLIGSYANLTIKSMKLTDSIHINNTKTMYPNFLKLAMDTGINLALIAEFICFFFNLFVVYSLVLPCDFPYMSYGAYSYKIISYVFYFSYRMLLLASTYLNSPPATNLKVSIP